MSTHHARITLVTTGTRPRRPALDALCAAAVDLARQVAEELAGADHVGDHVGVAPDDERVVTHYFACSAAGYRDWRWTVTLARAARSRTITVDEAVLLPSDEAVLAPDWLPWIERLQPNDLGPGDLLPTGEHDQRLAPGYTGADEPPREFAESAPVAYELGLGRARVLSPAGRDAAATRWYHGESSPRSAMARAAPARCATCGFLVSLRGSLRMAFGVCANELSPSDGRVVPLDYGCGAHSEAAALPATSAAVPPIVNELGYDQL